MCDDGVESASFTFGAKQVNFVVEVDYNESAYDSQYDPTLSTAVAGVKVDENEALAVNKFIKDGKLVIVNGNAEYNAAGAQIK